MLNVSVHKHKRGLKSAKLGLAANEKSFLIFRLIFACAAPKRKREPQLFTSLFKRTLIFINSLLRNAKLKNKEIQRILIELAKRPRQLF